MSFQFSEAEITTLFTDFQSIKKYADKVTFFDRHFSIVPFEFPKYEADIFNFFTAANISRLTEILRIEQKDLSFLERTFQFQHASYIFCIKPSSSQGHTLNEYIVSKFLSKSDQLGLLSQEANQMISFIRRRIDAEYEKKPSVEIQLMTVFMKGYSDSANNIRPPMFRRRRKFIELYLYVYGFLLRPLTNTVPQAADFPFQRAQIPPIQDTLGIKV